MHGSGRARANSQVQCADLDFGKVKNSLASAAAPFTSLTFNSIQSWTMPTSASSHLMIGEQWKEATLKLGDSPFPERLLPGLRVGPHVANRG
jgi:hypothetical protein